MAELTPTTIGWKTQPFYTRVAVFGLLLNCLVSLVFAVLSVIDGEASTVAFFIIFAALSGISVGLIRRFDKWGLVAGAIWGYFNLTWAWLLIIALSYPNSFFDFVMPLLLTVSGLLTGVGATVALVQQRRGATRTAATRTERRTVGAIVIVILGLVILSGILHIVGRTTVSTDAKAGAVVVQMKNSYLAPERLELRVGETTLILVKNNDFFVHTFEIDELGVDRTVLPFSELLIELRPTSTGEFTFRSASYMTGDMEGALVVTK